MIDSQGRSLAFGADYFQGEVPPLMATVPTKGNPTVFASTGDVVGIGSVLGIVARGGLATIRAIIDRRRERHSAS